MGVGSRLKVLEVFKGMVAGCTLNMLLIKWSMTLWPPLSLSYDCHKLVHDVMTFSRALGVGKLLCEVGDDGQVGFTV